MPENRLMVEALRDYWQPVFAAKDVGEPKVEQCINAHMPQGEPLVANAPNKEQIRASLAARRRRRQVLTACHMQHGW